MVRQTYRWTAADKKWTSAIITWNLTLMSFAERSTSALLQSKNTFNTPVLYNHYKCRESCAIWRGWWNIMKTHNDEGATPQIYSASCRSHLFGPNVLVRVETCSFNYFSMWITRFIALILSCHGFLSLNISFEKIINKQIEWFCIDTFENSAIKNVVTYHKSYRA
jgi:hypothetical protein